MTKIEKMEQSIKNTERISVKLFGNINPEDTYCINRLSGKETVTALRARISRCLPGVSVEIYDGIGNKAHGSLQLRNLRDTYDLDFIIAYREILNDELNDALAEIELLKNGSHKATSNQTELDPYDVLNIQKDAGEEAIREAYRKKSSRLHPDKIMGMDQSIIDYANKKMGELNVARDKALENLSTDERSGTSD
jgi:hypothetical protein